MRHIHLFFCCLLYLTLLMPLSLSAQPEQDKHTQRIYPIPEHGELILNVPSDWEVTYVESGKAAPPLITFFRKNEHKAIVFQLNLSILWDDGFERNITEPEEIKRLVEEAGNSALAHSEQTRLELVPVTGIMGTGYLFSLSDATPAPGEYRYLTQGALSVGEVLVVFSLFTHDTEPELRTSVLQLLETARHRFQRHVQTYIRDMS